jgi:hypothetical protein
MPLLRADQRAKGSLVRVRVYFRFGGGLAFPVLHLIDDGWSDLAVRVAKLGQIVVSLSNASQLFVSL